MIVRCIIGRKDGAETWEEELPVESLETAEKELKAIVKSFNDTLRPGEKPRKFIKLIGEEQETDVKFAFRVMQMFLQEMRLENQNLYGNAWVKERFRVINNAYNKYLETGKSTSLKGYVEKALIYVSDLLPKQKEELLKLLQMDLDKLYKDSNDRQS